ncbi:MAG: helix-turn-helix domain-containing protein [Egibacteraceae bacterium]
MLTVPEAAKRCGRHPETVRRWIRSGRLRAKKIGTQHVIEEADLDLIGEDEQLRLPPGWGTMHDGRPTPNVAKALRQSRRGR